MTDTNLTHLYFLLDRSGSMQSISKATQDGFNAFIADQREEAGRCRVTLAQFDDQYTEVYADRDLADVPALKLEPRGSTALLDALGKLIVTAGERLAALPEAERPATVVVGVMTDGYENASSEWTHPQIKALIEQQVSRYDWQFLYLGADQDAIEEGMKMGFEAGKSMTYDRGSAGVAMGAVSRSVRSKRGAMAAGVGAAEANLLMDFSEEERAGAAGK